MGFQIAVYFEHPNNERWIEWVCVDDGSFDISHSRKYARTFTNIEVIKDVFNYALENLQIFEFMTGIEIVKVPDDYRYL